MKLLKATIIRLRQGPDKVSIETDLPDASWPFREHLLLRFDCARGTAEAYLYLNFPDLDVVSVIDETKATSFSRT